MILADRAEERDKARQRKEIMKTANESGKVESRGPRLSGRQKKSGEKDTAIRQIEAARKRQEKELASAAEQV
ncbi:Plus3 domain-containing protein [Haematococcus lacustris]|uniref:Plus3 domain-containing protein n=1 Tax=Haematococcus lacustris TaxID=44745 RepID=A0A699ZYB2_HAELA|nr:Plus3 domain-containing protein [Haematococcus lacustris]